MRHARTSRPLARNALRKKSYRARLRSEVRSSPAVRTSLLSAESRSNQPISGVLRKGRDVAHAGGILVDLDKGSLTVGDERVSVGDDKGTLTDGNEIMYVSDFRGARALADNADSCRHSIAPADSQGW
ncbi:uncharacterized protein EI90DRAFT_3029794 [Cantharellus anzutake]|uniref:uncharacterized protein n=1 Tax=Cantharellus anzutake TaxID=1750568 RepID=UPI0019045005|nr:uncharacterized protein EI90DRAFT_3029794 [Cantharellus anzutake]KAF8342665.1 hypothetical protein EI90DRAFT_3029794 [Cantharellus anzutake]